MLIYAPPAEGQPNRLAWTTISKMGGVMRRIYKIGILHEHVAKNPMLHVETRSKTDYKPIVITPLQTLAILKSLPSPLHFALVLACAATALRDSEMLALRWSDVMWNEGRIRVSKRWAKGKDGETKTGASDGYVPLHPILAAHLRSWREQNPYSKDGDFLFPFFENAGLCSSLCSLRQFSSPIICGRPQKGRSVNRGRSEVRTS